MAAFRTGVRWLAMIAGGLAGLSSAAAEELSGKARVIDSNTIEIGGRRARLIGVDAPDLDQMCPTHKGETYPCGRVAAQTLVRIVKDGPLDCRGARTDSAGRLLVRCAIRGFDVGEQYVLTGRAFADPVSGEDYRRAEATAEKLREGMWRGEFQKPWDWRAVRAGGGMQPIGERFSIDRTEVTVGRFRAFTRATGMTTRAEREGGGHVYEGGWQRMAGWTWDKPLGAPAADDEPAVHVTYDEAESFCRWEGKRLPTDAEWLEAAYTERRAAPPAPFAAGTTYPYPTGTTLDGANCLADCVRVATVAVPSAITRGHGHARAGTTRAGVNGLYDMGGNVWEWVAEGAGDQRRTRGGSWWYGGDQMKADWVADKPRDFAAVYIGFRCARDGS